MNKLQAFALAILLVLSQSLSAQMDLSFLHSGKEVPQMSSFQPVNFPDARFYVSVPIISGISARLNSPVSINDIYGAENRSLTELAFKVGDGDRLGVDVDVSLLQVGFRLKDYGAVTIFANERYTYSSILPGRTANHLINKGLDLDDVSAVDLGTESVGEFKPTVTFEDDNIGVHLNSYREFGVGYIHNTTIKGKDVRVGGRIKYLQGLLSIESSPNSSIKILTDERTLVSNISINEPRLRTAGIKTTDEEDGAEYFFVNRNTGFGVDLGAEVDVNAKLTVGFALNNLGKIDWKERVENYSLNETTLSLRGANLNDLGEVSVLDSLEEFTEEETDTRAYTSYTPARLLFDGSYRVIKNGTIRASTLFSIQNGNHQQAYAIGYVHDVGKILDVSLTTSYLSKRGFAVGGGFSARLSVLQLYVSADNIPAYISTTSFTDANSINVRFGLNFLFGHTVKKEKVKKQKKQKESDGVFPDNYELDHLYDVDQ